LWAPWRTKAPADGALTQVVAAADGRGLVAVACYDAPEEGVPVAALGLVAPLCAEPVMRGLTRVRPAQPRPAAAPIALRATRSGQVDLALGVASATDAEGDVEAIVGTLEPSPLVAEALTAARAGRAVALVRTRESATVIASA
jgi:hypothetical protein